MEKYLNRNGDSGVVGYEIGDRCIVVWFTQGKSYLYTYESAGEYHIERMKELAMQGSGLNSYINKNVKHKYQ